MIATDNNNKIAGAILYGAQNEAVGWWLEGIWWKALIVRELGESRGVGRKKRSVYIGLIWVYIWGLMVYVEWCFERRCACW